MSRFARCERDTKETEIVIELDLMEPVSMTYIQELAFLTICWRDLPNMVCLIWQYRYREIPMWTPIIR